MLLVQNILNAAIDNSAHSSLSHSYSNSGATAINHLQLLLDSIDDLIFWKDKNRTYIGCNLAFAKTAGFNSVKEIIGKKDIDLIWDQSTQENYLAGDMKVLQGQTFMNAIEPAKTHSGYENKVKGGKQALLLPDGNIGGVLGIYNIYSPQPTFASLLDHFSSYDALKQILDRSSNSKKFLLEFNNQKIWLSRRETECILLLLTGKATKVIAQHLKLSERTVQNYLENIKSKVGYNKRSDLLNFIVDSNFLQQFTIS